MLPVCSFWKHPAGKHFIFHAFRSQHHRWAHIRGVSSGGTWVYKLRGIFSIGIIASHDAAAGKYPNCSSSFLPNFHRQILLRCRWLWTWPRLCGKRPKPENTWIITRTGPRRQARVLLHLLRGHRNHGERKTSLQNVLISMSRIENCW